MEIKKNPQADLENEKTTFFLLGMIVALAFLFVLLEWKTEKSDVIEWQGLPSVFLEEEFIGTIESPIFEQIESAEEINAVIEEPPVVYEDYNIVKEVELVVSEEVISNNIVDSTDSSEIIESDTILPKEDAEEIQTNPEKKPEFPGGTNALARYLLSNTKYPASARTQQKQGRVWCSFIVNKDGSVSDVKVENGVFISLDQEALRVLKEMPDWNPGTIAGNPVRTKVFVPIVFKL